MGHPSTPAFQVLHALQIKGVADVSTVAEITGLDLSVVQQQLDELLIAERARFHEGAGSWRLTTDGKAAHAEQLEADVAGLDTTALAELAEDYQRLLVLNDELKAVCGQWQLRDGEVNDHTDVGHDAAAIAALGGLHDRAHPLVFDIGQRIDRFRTYPERLAAALTRVRSGESKMFTGVMCSSYHTVWAELHHDLILTQGIDRTAEGSF